MVEQQFLNLKIVFKAGCYSSACSVIVRVSGRSCVALLHRVVRLQPVWQESRLSVLAVVGENGKTGRMGNSGVKGKLVLEVLVQAAGDRQMVGGVVNMFLRETSILARHAFLVLLVRVQSEHSQQQPM
ncbi:hypothetical protein E2C01_042758 [Portunus trituberculatus]|uniref:Uncharacterized protein n=1 Tax=Portunus trituberculatus TaxID=210409 RepID=A0A5B7FNF4_PORTR|nr:hypothetical protein [Portunus trituberculatus]